MSESVSCTSACWTGTRCRTCGKERAPRGRSVALEATSIYCTSECDGYDYPPHGRHLWNVHDSDRAYLDPEGWADHVANCEQCREAID